MKLLTRLSFLSLLLLFSSICFAEDRYALVWGGSCNWDHVPFAQQMSAISIGLSKNGWAVTNGFDEHPVEGHPTTLASKGALLEFLDDLVKNSKTSDEVLIYVDAHGSEETSGKTHGWSLPDCGTLTVDDSDFTSRLQKLKDKGVKIALADASCYGGNSIKHLDKYGCVVSNQGDSESFGDEFGDSLVKKLKNKKSGSFSVTDVFQGIFDQTPVLPNGAIIEPQMSGLLDPQQLFNTESKAFGHQYETMEANAHQIDTCSTPGAFDDFKNFEANLNEVLKNDPSLPKIDQKKLEEMQTLLDERDKIINRINSDIAMENSVPAPTVQIDLNSVSPFFKNTHFKDAQYKDLYEVKKDGTLLIRWNAASPDEVQHKIRAFIALDTDLPFTISDSFKEAQLALKAAATEAQAVSSNSLPPEDQAKLTSARASVNQDKSQLIANQKKVADASYKMEKDIRKVRLGEIKELLAQPPGAESKETDSLQNCKNFLF